MVCAAHKSGSSGLLRISTSQRFLAPGIAHFGFGEQQVHLRSDVAAALGPRKFLVEQSFGFPVISLRREQPCAHQQQIWNNTGVMGLPGGSLGRGEVPLCFR